MPATYLEQVLVQKIISASWRLERCAQIEANPEDDALRSLNRALKELRILQTNRVVVPPAAPLIIAPTLSLNTPGHIIELADVGSILFPAQADGSCQSRRLSVQAESKVIGPSLGHAPARPQSECPGWL